MGPQLRQDLSVLAHIGMGLNGIQQYHALIQEGRFLQLELGTGLRGVPIAIDDGVFNGCIGHMSVHIAKQAVLGGGLRRIAHPFIHQNGWSQLELFGQHTIDPLQVIDIVVSIIALPTLTRPGDQIIAHAKGVPKIHEDVLILREILGDEALIFGDHFLLSVADQRAQEHQAKAHVRNARSRLPDLSLHDPDGVF